VTVLILIPMVVTMSSYCIIIHIIKITKKRIGKKSAEFDVLSRNIMLFTLSLLLCWLPVLIRHLVRVFHINVTSQLCDVISSISSVSPWLRYFGEYILTPIFLHQVFCIFYFFITRNILLFKKVYGLIPTNMTLADHERIT